MEIKLSVHIFIFRGYSISRVELALGGHPMIVNISIRL